MTIVEEIRKLKQEKKCSDTWLIIMSDLKFRILQIT